MTRCCLWARSIVAVDGYLGAHPSAADALHHVDVHHAQATDQHHLQDKIITIIIIIVVVIIIIVIIIMIIIMIMIMIIIMLIKSSSPLSSSHAPRR
jgi:amino acid transporter